ncbi:MAG: hypothetical protein ACXVRE_12460, partial [Gaiellaceae bacterium]
MRLTAAELGASLPSRAVGRFRVAPAGAEPTLLRLAALDAQVPARRSVPISAAAHEEQDRH